MARVFLITSSYMGVLLIDELIKAKDKIVGVVAWPIEDYPYYTPPEYNVRTKTFKNYLPLYEPDPNELNSKEFIKIIKDLNPDFIVSGYYPKLFSKQILEIPSGGCINIHPTGLPRFRGLSPYFTHMLFGDEYNYITLHWLDSGADTGDIISIASVKIFPEDTGFTCGHRLTEEAAGMFNNNWPLIKKGVAPRQKQDESIASNFNFDWSISEINWQKGAIEIFNLVRSITKPYDGAWTILGKHKIHVWKSEIVNNSKSLEPGTIISIDGKGLCVQCGRGQLIITDLSIDGINISPLNLLIELGKKYSIKLGN